MTCPTAVPGLARTAAELETGNDPLLTPLLRLPHQLALSATGMAPQPTAPRAIALSHHRKDPALSLSPQQHTYYRLHGQLRHAAEATFEACLHLSVFTESTALFAETEAVGGETGRALADRHRAVQQILATVKTQSQRLQAESDRFAEAWEAHQTAMANELHPCPVSDDDRIARALAERFEDASQSEDLQELYDLLDALGLEPPGPAWARWGLDVRFDKLHWVPFVPTERQPPPAPPVPVGHVEATEDPHPAPAPPVVPAAGATAGKERA